MIYDERNYSGHFACINCNRRRPVDVGTRHAFVFGQKLDQLIWISITYANWKMQEA